MAKSTAGKGFSSVICLAFLAFALVTAEFLPISLLTPIGQDLDMSPAVTGQLVTITAIAATFGGPAILIFFRQTDRKNLLLWLIASLAFSGIASALTNSELVIISSRVLTGIALGGFWALSPAIVIRLGPPGQAARSLALIAAGVSTATVLSGPGAAIIADIFGWRVAMLGVGLLAVALFIATLWILPAIPVANRLRPAELIGVMRVPGVLRALSLLFLIVLGHFSAFVFIRPLLETVTLDANWISLRLLILGLCGVAGNFLGGAISSRSPLMSSAVSAVLLSSAGTGLLVGGAGGVIGAVSIGMWGLAFGAAPLSMQAHLLVVAPKNAEVIGAWNLAIFQLAITVGGLLGAYMVSAYNPVFLLLPLIALPLLAAVLIGTGKMKTVT